MSTVINTPTPLFTRVLTGATTLTAGDSEKLIVLNAAGGGAITMPTGVAGMKYKFVIGATAPTTAWVITTAEGTINGALVVAGAVVAAANENTITFVASTALRGDEATLVFDGTTWHITANGTATGAITATSV
jgi:hypothetical protein